MNADCIDFSLYLFALRTITRIHLPPTYRQGKLDQVTPAYSTLRAGRKLKSLLCDGSTENREDGFSLRVGVGQGHDALRWASEGNLYFFE